MQSALAKTLRQMKAKELLSPTTNTGLNILMVLDQSEKQPTPAHGEGVGQ